MTSSSSREGGWFAVIVSRPRLPERPEAPRGESRRKTKSAETYAATLLELCAEGEGPPGIDASLGIAVYPDHAGDAEGLTGAADAAMYEAKRAGGGRLAVAPTADAPASH